MPKPVSPSPDVPGAGQPADARPGPASTPRPRSGLRLACSVACSGAVAVTALGLLELTQALGRGISPLGHLAEVPARLLLLGSLVLWLLLIFLTAVLGRLWVAAAILLSLVAAVGAVNYQKLRLRLEPVYPTDVVYLRDLTLLDEYVTAPAVLGLALAVAVIATGAFLVSRLSRRVLGLSTGPSRGRRLVLLRVGTVVLAGAVLVSAANFNDRRNPVRGTFEAAGAAWATWDQGRNYTQNGFMSGFLYNMPVPVMRRPAGYSEAALDRLVHEYSRIASRINAERRVDALRDTNVVLVLGESFIDPLALQGLVLAEDPIPFTRRLMATNTAGTMLSSGYGGGTADVEFEVLTGMTGENFEPQVTTPYQMLVSRQATFPSFLRSLGSPGHEKVAIHPYAGSFYQRSASYAALGFTRTKFRGQMTHTEQREREPYISDSAAFAELIDEIVATEAPVVANVVTMQNHGPYHWRYDSPIEGEDAHGNPLPEEVTQYMRGLRYSDQALQELVENLQDLPERTIMLYYGDHHAAVWPPSVLDQETARAKYETPFFVFANFETRKVTTGEALSPPFLVNQMLGAANAPLTPYGALLEELAEEMPVLKRRHMRETTGTPAGSRVQGLLADYRLLQYDLSVGERFSADEVFTAVSSPPD